MYSLFLSDGSITIVKTEKFEDDENLNTRLYRDKDFEIVRFSTEKEARKFLNDTFREEFIDFRYRTSGITFWEKMKK